MRIPNGEIGRTPQDRALTFIEALVAIFVIVLFAALLTPAISPRHVTPKVIVARIEMANLCSAISQYQSEYSALPVSSNAAKAAAALRSDFTFGTVVRGTKAEGGVGSPLE